MSSITRRKDQGLGKTAAGGSGGSFSSHDREGAAAPPVTQEIVTTPAQDVIDRLNDSESSDEFGEELWGVARNHVQHTDSFDRELVFISYDEQLHGKQIDTYLAGDVDGELDNELYELYDDSRYDRSQELAGEMLEGWGVDSDDVGAGVKDELAEIIRDYDESNPAKQLAKNTHAQLMRAPIGQEGLMDSAHDWAKRSERGYTYDELYNGNAERSAEARNEYLLDYLERSGVNTGQLSHEDREQIKSLATEGPHYWHEGVRLDAIWHGDVGDAKASGDPAAGRTLRLGGSPAHNRSNEEGHASVVLLDSVNGSGYDARLSVPLNVTVDSSRPAALDSGGSSYGYGWDDTAGVHKPAYGVAVSDVTGTSFDEDSEAYRRSSDGRLTPGGQQRALRDIESALSGKNHELRAYGQKYQGFDRSSVSEAELDRLDSDYNQLYDDISELNGARHRVQVNRGVVLEGSSEWLAMNNID